MITGIIIFGQKIRIVMKKDTSIYLFSILLIFVSGCISNKYDNIIKIIEYKSKFLTPCNFKPVVTKENTDFMLLRYECKLDSTRKIITVLVEKPFYNNINDSSKVHIVEYNQNIELNDTVARTRSMYNYDEINYLLKHSRGSIFYYIHLKYPKIDLGKFNLVQIEDGNQISRQVFQSKNDKQIEDFVVYIKKPSNIYIFEQKDLDFNNIVFKTINCDTTKRKIGLTFELDTLFDYYQVDDNYMFTKGKYYYYFLKRPHLLDSLQKSFYMKNKDSIIKNCINEIPEF